MKNKSQLATDDREPKNLEVITTELWREMHAYAKSINTEENSYAIHYKEWEWLARTNPSVRVMRALFMLESKRETRNERRIVKQFLDGNYTSKRFPSQQKAACFESKLLQEYGNADDAPERARVPRLYNMSGNHCDMGVVIMDDLGTASFREKFEMIPRGENNESQNQLYHQGLSVLDGIHAIAHRNPEISKIVERAPYTDFEEKIKYSYRILMKPENLLDPKKGMKHPVEGEDEFLQAIKIILKHMRMKGDGKGQPIHGDIKPDHLIGDRLCVVDFGSSRSGFVEYDAAGILFSDLPFPVEQAIEVYARHYKNRGPRSIARLITSGIFEAVATVAYVTRLRTLHENEFEHLRERSPRFVTPSLYQERVWTLTEALRNYVNDETGIDTAKSALDRLFAGSMIELNEPELHSEKSKPHRVLNGRKTYASS